MITEEEMRLEHMATTPVVLDPALAEVCTQAASEEPTGRQLEAFAWMLNSYLARQARKDPLPLPRYWRNNVTVSVPVFPRSLGKIVTQSGIRIPRKAR